MKGVRKIATTGIWKIEKRLDNVIDYTTNIEKTMPDRLIIKDSEDLKKKLSERIEKIESGKAKMLTIDEIDSL